MILISKRILYFFVILVLGFFFILGIQGYVYFLHAAENIGQEMQFLAERILFLTLIFAIVATVLFFHMLRKSRNILKELDKIIELSRFSRFSSDLSIQKLGPLGDKVALLYNQISELSEKKTLKISALHNLNDFLINNIQLPLLITDVTGTIVHASKQYLDSNEKNRSEVLDASIQQLYQEIDIKNIILMLIKNKAPIENESISNTHVSFFPILNREGSITYVVCVFERFRVITTISKKTEDTIQKVESPKLLRRVFSRWFQ